MRYQIIIKIYIVFSALLIIGGTNFLVPNVHISIYNKTFDEDCIKVIYQLKILENFTLPHNFERHAVIFLVYFFRMQRKPYNHYQIYFIKKNKFDIISTSGVLREPGKDNVLFIWKFRLQTDITKILNCRQIRSNFMHGVFFVTNFTYYKNVTFNYKVIPNEIFEFSTIDAYFTICENSNRNNFETFCKDDDKQICVYKEKKIILFTLLMICGFIIIPNVIVAILIITCQTFINSNRVHAA